VDDVRPKLVGARVQRLEDPRLLTGAGTFVDDRQPPRLVQVALRRSVHAHARLRRIDCAAAATMPGVVGIFAASDLAGTVKPIRATSRMKDYRATSLLPLASQKVRFVGEPIVAVVAENRYLAEDALEKIEIDYEVLPTVIDPVAAADPQAPLLHDEAKTNIIAAREFGRGDVDAAFAAAALRVGARFRFTRKTPMAIENRAYLAEYDTGKRAITLYSTTQVPGIIRDALVELIDIPGNRIRVVTGDVGGGFGGKASLYPEEVLVCLLARRLGRPVKWTSDRVEDLLSTSQAFDEIVDAEIAVDGAGKILALSADVTGDVGAYSIYPWTAVLEPVQVASFMPGPYRIANYRGRVRAVATSKAPTGPYRGVGRPISTFVTERLVDMAAARLGIDPAEMRLNNFVRDDEFPYKTASGIVWDRSSFRQCLTRARDALGYEAARDAQKLGRAAERWIGIGFASYAELTGIGSRISASPGMPINTGTESSTIRIDSTGAVTALFGVSSHGQGLETSLAQIVADELGARFEDIEIVQGDSAASAHGTGSYASRSAVLAGGAATLAARAVRDKIVRVAAHLFEASMHDIDAADGRIFIPGTDKSMTFRELARAVYSEIGRLPKELQEDLEATKLYDPYFGTATSATHAAMVEIDPETYEVRVARYVVAEDCGRLINPMIVDGQVHGGVAQGIGAALYEEIIHDGAGQCLTASLMDYLVPTAAEIPVMEVIHLETVAPATLGGFRGMGEGGTIGAPAAIANAISDALAPLGIEIATLPATPERLFRLIEAARATKA
jgi:carbon-monoxide dehydrogenase large subunit